jgi:hypothetical protein
VAEILDEELAEDALSRTSLLLVDRRSAIFAVGHVQGDGTPWRGRQVVDLGEQLGCAPARGEEGDASGIEPIEALVGGELRIEDQMLRRTAVLALPERDEAKDLFGFFTLADVGIGVAEDLAVGVLGQEGENAGLATAAFGQIMGLDQRMLAELRHGMKVEIERLAAQQVLAGHPGVPQRKQAQDVLRGDARGIFRQKALLGHSI